MLQCKTCKQVFLKPKNFFDHVRNHTNLPNVRFTCGFASCNRTFKVYRSFLCHTKRDHFSQKSHEMNLHEDIESFKCTIFSCLKECRSLHKLLTHLKIHIKSGVCVTCPFKYCTKSYNKESSFRSHISRHHKKKYTLCNKQHTETNIASTSAETDNEPSCHDIFTQHDNNNILKDLSLFYLRLHCKQNIPATTIQIIVDELSKFHESWQENLIDTLSSKFVQYNVESETAKKILVALKESDSFNDAQTTLQSEFLRKKHFKHNFSYVQPVTIKLGINDKNKQCMFQYIPIKQTLKAILTDDSIAYQYLNPLSPESDLLGDFTDGSVFKKNNFFKENKSALQLILYQDSFEIVNPLGSAKNKHKILAVYLTLGNIHKHNRSKVNPIQLVLLCNEKNYKLFGQEAVFRPLINDLKDLETDGITIKNSKVKGTVVFIAGDNLGSHNIGGFNESFSQGYICRYCEITSNNLQNSPHLLAAPNRTTTSYNTALEVIETEFIKSAFGIKFNSIFNELKFYHVCSPGLPPCLGHDIFEGVIAYDIPLYIKYFVKTLKWFTYKFLNSSIEHFIYKDEDAKNKPNIINPNTDKLSGHAVQNFTLLRFLSLYLRYKISDKNNDVWHLINNLQEIVVLVCSTKISYQQVNYLDSLIKEYIFYRKILFPTNNLRPKHHYMVHYPELILKFGPLIWVWTLRFESKHLFFKKCIQNSKNFKNVTHTLAERHQLFQAYLRAGSYFDDFIQKESCVPFKTECFSNAIQIAIKDCFQNETNLLIGHNVTLSGNKLKIGQAIALQTEIASITIGIIEQFIFQKNNLYFLIKAVDCSKVQNFNMFYFTDECVFKIMCISYNDILGHPFPIYETLKNLNLRWFRALVCIHLHKVDKEAKRGTTQDLINTPVCNEDPQESDSNISPLISCVWDNTVLNGKFYMESVQLFIFDCLPALANDTATASSVMNILHETGVETYEDLQYLDPEKDFAGILKPIQNRKLLQKISTTFKSISEVDYQTFLPPVTTSLVAKPAETSIVLENSRNDFLQDLPVQKFPPEVLNKLKKNVRPTPAERREVVRILAADTLDKVPNAKKGDLCQVARKLLELYPNSFRDELLDTPIGTGYAGLLGQLIARVENVRRIPSSAMKRAISTVTSNNVVRRKVSDAYGCVNFQPESFPNDETEQSQNEKKTWLISEFCKGTRELEKINNYMSDTYVSQRILINSRSPVSLVLKEWPFLTERRHMLQHANTLLGFDVSARLEEAMTTKVPVLKTFFQSTECKKRFKNYNFIPPATSFLHMLCLYFEEDFDSIFKVLEETASLDEAAQNGPATPFIACIGDPYGQGTICTVVVEQQCLQNMITLMEAILIWFICFYTLNLQYPLECPATLEFIQRAFLGINPTDRGSKFTKRLAKRTQIHPKVLKLTNKLKNFTSPWQLVTD